MSEPTTVEIDHAVIHVHEAPARVEKLCYSLGEAAVMLSLGERSLRELVYTGQLKAIRVGDRVLIPRSSLVEFVEIQLEQGGSDLWEKDKNQTRGTNGRTGRDRSSGAKGRNGGS